LPAPPATSKAPGTKTDPLKPSSKDHKPKVTSVNLSDLSTHLPFFVGYCNSAGTAIKITKFHVFTDDPQFADGQVITVTVGKLAIPNVEPTKITIDKDAGDTPKGSPMKHLMSGEDVDRAIAECDE
jgi:hypothetical protein